MSETGHTRNIANFEILISFCTSYGADYNPANASSVTVLWAKTWPLRREKSPAVRNPFAELQIERLVVALKIVRMATKCLLERRSKYLVNRWIILTMLGDQILSGEKYMVRNFVMQSRFSTKKVQMSEISCAIDLRYAMFGTQNSTWALSKVNNNWKCYNFDDVVGFGGELQLTAGSILTKTHPEWVPRSFTLIPSKTSDQVY